MPGPSRPRPPRSRPAPAGGAGPRRPASAGRRRSQPRPGPRSRWARCPVRAQDGRRGFARPRSRPYAPPDGARAPRPCGTARWESCAGSSAPGKRCRWAPVRPRRLGRGGGRTCGSCCGRSEGCQRPGPPERVPGRPRGRRTRPRPRRRERGSRYGHRRIDLAGPGREPSAEVAHVEPSGAQSLRGIDATVPRPAVGHDRASLG